MVGNSESARPQDVGSSKHHPDPVEEIHVSHQWQTRLFTNLPGDLEWRHTSAATCVASNPHLDPNDAIPVLLNGFQALISVE